MMNIYLDDNRRCPEGWTPARSVEEAKRLLAMGNVTHLSLDYDLGYGSPTGLDLCEWLRATGNWPTESITIHSSHPLGRARLAGFLRAHAPKRLF